MKADILMRTFRANNVGSTLFGCHPTTKTKKEEKREERREKREERDGEILFSVFCVLM